MSLPAGKAVAAVLALGAGSVLAYNWITTGCPSGVCATESSAAVIPVAGAAESEKSGDACCPLMAEVADTAKAELPACCAALGEAACGDASKCADMVAAPEQTTAVIETVSAEPAKDACCASKPAETTTETASTQP